MGQSFTIMVMTAKGERYSTVPAIHLANKSIYEQQEYMDRLADEMIRLYNEWYVGIYHLPLQRLFVVKKSADAHQKPVLEYKEPEARNFLEKFEFCSELRVQLSFAFQNVSFDRPRMHFDAQPSTVLSWQEIVGS